MCYCTETHIYYCYCLTEVQAEAAVTRIFFFWLLPLGVATLSASIPLSLHVLLHYIHNKTPLRSSSFPPAWQLNILCPIYPLSLLCWSTECLQEWGSYMKLAIPSALMICFEWWIWELGGFFAGLLGEVDLAAQHVLMEIGTIVYMFPLGVHAAACVRVGNALGAGNTTRALVSCRVALVLSGIKIHDIYLKSQTYCVCSGILVGSGMQKIAAISNLVGYYCIGLPVGIALMFAAKLRILGNHGDSNANARGTEQSKNTKPKVLLSATQLILRRGTTLLVSVLILIIGVAFYIAFPVPGLSAQSRANFTLNGANGSTPTPVTLNLTLDF
uniref:Solute carrier family 47 member 1 n=1 Tax=Amphilophus citrinellus TaxID=61819 RepID=A0A3Q0S3N5_AMPCI